MTHFNINIFKESLFFSVYDNLMAVESNFLLVYEDSHLNFCRIIDTGSRKNSLNLCIEIEIVWTKPSKHAFTNRWNLDRGILIAPLKVDSEYNQAKSIKLSVQKSISCRSYINEERMKIVELWKGRARFKDFKRHI